jgi:hypothetical protein
MPTLFVQRGDGGRDALRGIRPDRNRENDNIPLIALDIFQVLDEDGFVPPLFVEEGFEIRIGAPLFLEQVFDEALLISIEGYYGGRLVAFPSPVTTDRAVRLVRVADGLYERGSSNRINRPEARVVVAEVVRRL